jgi:hypothetical protein
MLLVHNQMLAEIRMVLQSPALVLTCGLSSGFRVAISSYQSFWAA